MRTQFEDEKRRVNGEVHGVKRLRDDSIAVHSPYRTKEKQEATAACEIDIQAPEVFDKGADWIVGYPKTKTLDVSLLQSLDHPSVVCCARFSNDGTMLATGCSRTAQVFDVVSGNKIADLADEATREGEIYIRSVCFSPDGKYLATGAEDKIIRIWDLSKRRVRFALQGHEQNIYSLDWSRDGKFVVSGSGDKSLKLWDMESGRALKTMLNDGDILMPKDGVPKESGVTSVAFNPTISHLVVTVRLLG
jgi:glucose repression regulatory protein TUP1